ncbi:hypothetical protein I4U23_017230 [Adineta vaga]|nr:hypothetical protein I4U23_017230 [Adineta vaga]
MKIIGIPLIVFIVTILCIQMIEIEAGDKKTKCQAGVTGTIAWASAAPCLAAGPFGALFCAIAVPIATTFATGACKDGRRKRAAGNKKCFYSKKLKRSVCITPQLMYKLGEAASESCNNKNHGKQKCVGNEGFITCVYNNWSVKQLCGKGTKCKKYPTSDRHVLCG